MAWTAPFIDREQVRSLAQIHRHPDGRPNATEISELLGSSRRGIQHILKLLKEEVSYSPSFSIPVPPVVKERPLSELIDHCLAESERAKAYEEYSKLIRIDIHTDGPVGFMVFGDPHVDNPGRDFGLLKRHLDLAAARSEYVFAGNIGDLRDNWIGRLERLYAQGTMNSKEVWRLVEWMMRDHGVKWTWLTRGNHDCFSGGINDPLDWIVKGGVVGVDGDTELRLAFHHPNGAVTRLHARHDFPGASQFNPLHGLKKEQLHGFRDHIIVAGHRHVGADAGDVNGDGMVFQMVRVSGYKISDAYRVTIGARAAPIHPAALIIVDPSEPDTSRARVWCAPTIEVGMKILDILRQDWRSSHGPPPHAGVRLRRAAKAAATQAA